MLTTFIAQPSYSDDVTINLDQSTPYVDVPVTVVDSVDATVSTTTGQTNSGHWIDSWIELWQGTTRLIYNDDGNHSNTNVLASIFTIPLQAGEYFIRATSWNYIVGGKPIGSYLLSTNLVVTTPVPTPSPTVTEPTPEPSLLPTETATPTPSPSETSSEQPFPEPSPTPSETPSQPENLPDQDNSPMVQPSPESLPTLPVEANPESVAPVEPDVLELPVEDLTSTSSPSSLKEISPIDENQSLLSLLPEFSLENFQETLQQISETISAALESIPGGEQILAAIQSVNNLGSEYTPEERKQAQQVVLGAVILTQISTHRRVK